MMLLTPGAIRYGCPEIGALSGDPYFREGLKFIICGIYSRVIERKRTRPFRKVPRVDSSRIGFLHLAASAS